MSKHSEILFIAKSPVGASEVFFDLFNAANSGYDLHVASVKPIVSGAVAVTGALGLDLFLTFTTAVGTAGTAATRTGTSLTASTFGSTSPVPSVLPLSISARRLPTGGATAGAVISHVEVFIEETNAGTYLDKDFISPKMEDVVVPQGFGIQVQQGAVASVGNIGFMVVFALVAK